MIIMVKPQTVPLDRAALVRLGLQNGLGGSPCSPRDSQESSPTPQFKSINSSALSFLHSPTLTSIHDHQNHSLEISQTQELDGISLLSITGPDDFPRALALRHNHHQKPRFTKDVTSPKGR